MSACHFQIVTKLTSGQCTWEALAPDFGRMADKAAAYLPTYC